MFKYRMTPFFDADKGAGGADPADLEKETGGNPEDKTPSGEGEGGNERKEILDAEGRRLLTEDEVNALIQARIARDRKKQDEEKEKIRAEEERKRLEEEGKYKDVAASLQAELDRLKSEAMEAKRESALAKAGYDEDQIARYKKFVEGESEEDIAASVKALLDDVPPKKEQKDYADPALGNGGRGKPVPKDKEAKGREYFQRLKKSGKIR